MDAQAGNRQRMSRPQTRIASVRWSMIQYACRATARYCVTQMLVRRCATALVKMISSTVRRSRIYTVLTCSRIDTQTSKSNSRVRQIPTMAKIPLMIKNDIRFDFRTSCTALSTPPIFIKKVKGSPRQPKPIGPPSEIKIHKVIGTNTITFNPMINAGRSLAKRSSTTPASCPQRSSTPQSSGAVYPFHAHCVGASGRGRNPFGYRRL